MSRKRKAKTPPDPLRKAWSNMHSRCNGKYEVYKCYTEKGITVCTRWHIYDNFAADMGPHPGEGLSLERIKNHKGYSKSNCKWATPTEQSRHRDGYVKLTMPDAEYIRILAAKGIPHVEIAAMYNMTPPNVWHVVTRRTWK